MTLESQLERDFLLRSLPSVEMQMSRVSGLSSSFSLESGWTATGRGSVRGRLFRTFSFVLDNQAKESWIREPMLLALVLVASLGWYTALFFGPCATVSSFGELI